MSCVIQSLSRMFQCSEALVIEDLGWDGNEERPPHMHQVIDYCMSNGLALTPIDRRPKIEHMGQIIHPYLADNAEERFLDYLNGYMGLTLGKIEGGRGHMAFFDHGEIRDRSFTYPFSKVEYYGYNITTILVATWQE